MLKILLWVVSKDTTYLEDALNILERQHNGIELVDTVAGEEIAAVDGAEYDVLLVVGAKEIGMSKITQAVRQLNLPEEKLLGDWIVCIPGFTLNKYRRLQRSRLSIFAINCFGGCICHTLGLPFLSPFVNFWLNNSDFLKFLRAPHAYLAKELTFKEMNRHEVFEYNYPVAMLGDITFQFVHYHDFDTAANDWNLRKTRINFENLFVTTNVESEKFLQKFDALPYTKKVCFVPFKSDLNSAWHINPEIDFDRTEEGFHDVVNNFARGKIFYYDVFDMLLYGKKTPLIDM